MSTGKSLCVVFVWLASLVLAGAPSDPSTPYSWNLPKNPHNARAMLGLRSTMCSRSG